MAHNLATIAGQIAMAYQGATPWHKLGKRISSSADIAAVLVAAALDWTVRTESLFLADGRQVENRRAVVRNTDGVVLSTVSDSYTPIQYPDAFGVFGDAMIKYGLTIEAAGALGKGERAWMLFKLPSVTAPVSGDEVRGYGVAVSSHDGSNTFEFRPTPVRVVCQNTLSMALGKGGNKGRIFGISHTSGSKIEVPQAGKVVDRLLDTMKHTGDTFAAMARRTMTPGEVVAYIESVFPGSLDGNKLAEATKFKRATVAELMFSGVGASLAMSETNGQPNVWAAYNAVTEYFDHVATGKAKSASAKIAANTSAIFGHGADIKLLAMKRAQELVTA